MPRMSARSYVPPRPGRARAGHPRLMGHLGNGVDGRRILRTNRRTWRHDGRATSRCAIVLFLAFLAFAPAAAGELKFVTWNLNWLTARQTGLPQDVTPRTTGDFDRLRSYARQLNADVVAIEEVDNAD